MAIINWFTLIKSCLHILLPLLPGCTLLRTLVVGNKREQKLVWGHVFILFSWFNWSWNLKLKLGSKLTNNNYTNKIVNFMFSFGKELKHFHYKQLLCRSWTLLTTTNPYCCLPLRESIPHSAIHDSQDIKIHTHIMLEMPQISLCQLIILASLKRSPHIKV